MLENIFFKEIKNYVFKLLKEKLPIQVVYHNFKHTLQVVEAAQEVGLAEGLKEQDLEELLVASWFHDTGYISGFENHESESKKIAQDYLKQRKIDDEKIQRICTLIDATRMPHEPTNKLEEILCDADMFHLGNENFKEITNLLRAEFEVLCNKNLTDVEWFTENEKFLANHSFFTNYAFEKLNQQKALNWLKVKKDLNKALVKTEDKLAIKAEDNRALKAKKEKANRSDRGIETMWRVTLTNHIKLSDIADTKANILLSVSAIIMSITLTTLVPKLDNASNYYLIYPTGIFLIATVSTIIASITATRPKVTSNKFTVEDVKNKKVNLLFFGNFHKMKLEAFEKGMIEVMNDKDYLYKSLAKDLYFLGVVLAKKYKLLRIAYTIFMIGIILSVIAFVISFRLMRIETGVI